VATVIGPFDFNGVPLKRVNQAYVIATSTKIDISKVAVPAKIDDKYFKKAKAAKKEKTSAEFLAKPAEKVRLIVCLVRLSYSWYLFSLRLST
jgi:large subunit ribosomal protein L6e